MQVLSVRLSRLLDELLFIYLSHTTVKEIQASWSHSMWSKNSTLAAEFFLKRIWEKIDRIRSGSRFFKWNLRWKANRAVYWNWSFRHAWSIIIQFQWHDLAICEEIVDMNCKHSDSAPVTDVFPLYVNPVTLLNDSFEGQDRNRASWWAWNEEQERSSAMKKPLEMIKLQNPKTSKGHTLHHIQDSLRRFRVVEYLYLGMCKSSHNCSKRRH